MKVSYETSAAKSSQLPPESLPEIALIGKSNVGKSSLINALLNYKGLARISRAAGRTRMANFFRVMDHRFVVDLPGYGYTTTSNKDHKDWEDLILSYLSRNTIILFLFLWDPRRDLGDIDISLLTDLSKKAPVTLILTKCDKLPKSELNKRSTLIENELHRRGVRLKSKHEISSLKATGILALRSEILDF